MKIAIIGSGIAGNTLAHHLNQNHEITVFEANSYIGGHTHTHDIEILGEKITVDTGFIVFNDHTYPNFNALLDQINVPWQVSDMSFSVRCEKTNLEYNGTTLNSLFAQRRNLFKPSFYGMIRDILRFNEQSLELLADGEEIKLGDYLQNNNYKKKFIRHYIVPMGAAIWSTDTEQMMNFPARFFVRFFHHHGMLTVNNRPEWRTVKGGSKRYVEALTKPFIQSIKLNTPISNVKRNKNSVIVKPVNSAAEQFDYVFFACHSDQALQILDNPSESEQEVLGAIPYQENDIYLHYDINMMPKKQRAWAAWNYHLPVKPLQKVAVTYNMNILQKIQSKQPVLVTLNHIENIDEAKVLKKIKYMHPVYTLAGTKAQAKHSEISGHNRTGYAGAYWRNGFHEDGVASALAALKHFKTWQKNKMSTLE